MVLFYVALAAIFGAYFLGRVFGSRNGFKNGHQAGWIERHNESTPEEVEAWRSRQPSRDYHQRTQS